MAVSEGNCFSFDLGLQCKPFHIPNREIIMLSRENKLRRYRALKNMIPILLASDGRHESQESQVLDWLVANLHASRQTAKIWNMTDSPRPMPESKLKIMERLLTQKY